MVLLKMIKSRIVLFSFLCLLRFNINAAESPSSKENCCQEQHTSSLLNTAQNAAIGAATAYVVYRFLPPMFDHAEKGFNYVYLNYWLTEEQRIALQTKQAEDDQKLVENFQKAEMSYRIYLMETERGKNILLRKEEQNIRLSNNILKEDELKLKAIEREELSKDIEFIHDLMNKSSDKRIAAKLQEKYNHKVSEYAKST